MTAPGPAEIVGVTMLAALTAYALLGGADFGGGVWDLVSRGPRSEAQRRAIAEAMGPVWEANHVWLIFFLVLLFTAFPPAFAVVGIAFFGPLHLVLAGILLRGGAFVFRSHGAFTGVAKRAWGVVFGTASAMTPFLLGVALAALSSGAVRVGGGLVAVDPVRAYLSPFALVTGATALALSAHLAAVYLTVEAKGEVREDARRWALQSAAGVAVLAGALLPLMAADAPHLFRALVVDRPGLLVAGGIFAAASGAALYSRWYALARILAGAEVTALVWGWGVAQWPYLIYPDLTATATAAPRPALVFILETTAVGLVFLLPSLYLLFRVFKGENPATAR